MATAYHTPCLSGGVIFLARADLLIRNNALHRWHGFQAIFEFVLPTIHPAEPFVAFRLP